MGYWWDSSNQSLCDLGLPEDYVNDNTLQPWHGYWVQYYADNLALIIPAN